MRCIEAFDWEISEISNGLPPSRGWRRTSTMCNSLFISRGVIHIFETAPHAESFDVGTVLALTIPPLVGRNFALQFVFTATSLLSTGCVPLFAFHFNKPQNNWFLQSNTPMAISTRGTLLENRRFSLEGIHFLCSGGSCASFGDSRCLRPLFIAPESTNSKGTCVAG